MNRLLCLTGLAAAAIGLACGDPDTYQTDIENLVANERAFASKSTTDGTRAAFLEFLSDSGIVFGDTPTNGKDLWISRPESETVLFWQPVFADVSSNGEFGYTTGPWEYSVDSEADPTAWGHYVTVWQKTPSGVWRFAIDGGIVHEMQPVVETHVDTPGPESSRTRAEHSISMGAGILENLDRAYSNLAADSGVAKALLAYASEDVRVYRDGVFPMVGREFGSNFINTSGYNSVTWEPMSEVLSAAGDLGFTYGTATVSSDGTETRTVNYLHIWKLSLDGQWQVVLDLLTPSPPPET